MTLPAVCLLYLLAAPPESLNKYIGEYTLVPSETSDLKKVIEQTAAGLNFLVRSIARSRLRKTQIAFPLIRITRKGDEFRIAHEQGTDVTHRNMDDPVDAVSPDGSKIVVRLNPGPPLTETYQSGEGMRTNRYILSPDGAKLTVEVQVTSPRLKNPIEYHLAYQRK